MLPARGQGSGVSRVPPSTHADGLEQRPLVVPPELCADLPQVQLTAGHHDPGQHLLPGAFALGRQDTVTEGAPAGRPAVATATPRRGPGTFMASLSLLAKYSCLFWKHSTGERRRRQPAPLAARRGASGAAALPRVRKERSRSPFTSFLMLSLMSYGL